MYEGFSLTEVVDLIDGRFAVDVTKPLPGAGGGLPAFLARDQLMADAPRAALAVSRDASPRLAIMEFLGDPLENLMTPLGRGIATSADRGGEDFYVICSPPPGAPLSESKERWTDRALIDLVLRPIAQVLDTLQECRITHRAIRLNNVFQGTPGQPVTLGAAWAAPPAWHQPAIAEPIYSAMCHHAGRGEGSTADDVYALGVLLLCLASGSVPLADMNDTAMIQWKLDQGSYAALTRDFAPSGLLGDMLRGMLADDPDHRPPPKLLLDTASARGRRLVSRPLQRAQRPLRINDVAASDSRALAYALSMDEGRSMQALRSGVVSQWLRRDLGDAMLAAQVEELVRARTTDTQANAISDPLVVLQIITIINPRMPLCWRGVLLWPDSLPALLAAAMAGARALMVVVEELLSTDVISTWSAMPVREGRGANFALPAGAAAHRQSLVTHQLGGRQRLFYALNPELPCRARQTADRWVTTMTALMQQLERTAQETDTSLIDVPLAAFIICKSDRRIEALVSELIMTKDPEQFRLRELDLLRELQQRYHPAPLPRLAKWMAERVKPELNAWQNKPRREALAARLAEAAKSGSLVRLLTVMRNPSGLAADATGAEQARAELRRVEAELVVIDEHGTLRMTHAEKAGQAIVGGLGLVVLIMAALRIVVP